ncbi:hypothetical protein SAMN06295997_101136 [Malaciobacter marinus]|nr:hypothetical protein SAMN06295997_101136 [Malaciobacter marinus]
MFLFQYIICFGSRTTVEELEGIAWISIHHMFWFKPFNTICLPVISHFNTSYVLVQEQQLKNLKGLLGFQYIICFGSSKAVGSKDLLHILFQYIICFGSRLAENKKIEDVSEFQYIICFGSRLYTRIETSTSIKFQYIICFGSSIASCIVVWSAVLFQYIICFGSSIFLLQPLSILKTFQYIICFGSSYSCVPLCMLCKNFNTSYVLVQVFIVPFVCTNIRISIHHMFWFKIVYS